MCSTVHWAAQPPVNPKQFRGPTVEDGVGELHLRIAACFGQKLKCCRCGVGSCRKSCSMSSVLERTCEPHQRRELRRHFGLWRELAFPKLDSSTCDGCVRYHPNELVFDRRNDQGHDVPFQCTGPFASKLPTCPHGANVRTMSDVGCSDCTLMGATSTISGSAACVSTFPGAAHLRLGVALVCVPVRDRAGANLEGRVENVSRSMDAKRRPPNTGPSAPPIKRS